MSVLNGTEGNIMTRAALTLGFFAPFAYLLFRLAALV